MITSCACRRRLFCSSLTSSLQLSRRYDLLQIASLRKYSFIISVSTSLPSLCWSQRPRARWCACRRKWMPGLKLSHMSSARRVKLRPLIFPERVEEIPSIKAITPLILKKGTAPVPPHQYTSLELETADLLGDTRAELFARQRVRERFLKKEPSLSPTSRR